MQSRDAPRGGAIATSVNRRLIRWRHHLLAASFELLHSVFRTYFRAIMFRTAARSFAASAWRNAESFSQLEAAHQTAINISKAQGVGQRGFLDGNVGHSSRELLVLTTA